MAKPGGGEMKNEDERDRNEDQSNVDEISNFLPGTLKRGTIAEPTWRDTLKQVIASCIVHCIVIQAGINMAYSTVLVGGLEKEGKSSDYNVTMNGTEDRRMMVTEYQTSWISSLVTITLPIGSLIAGPLMDRFGRKTLSIALCVPTAISWLLIIFANSLTMIYVARSIAGVSAGLTTVGLVYVIEITHPRIRAMLLCLNSVFVSLGILFTCLFAVWLDWRKMAIVFLILEIAIFFALFTVPESPHWLLYFGDKNADRVAKGEKSIRWLNPRAAMYEQEYARIKETYRKTDDCASDTPAKFILARCKYFLTELKRPIVYKPLILLAVILVIQQMSGAYVVIFYAMSVFREMGGTFGRDLDEYGALLLLGILRFLMSILTAYLSRTIGRRTLCIASGLGMAFAMFFSAMLIYLSFPPSDTEDLGTIVLLDFHGLRWIFIIIVLFYVCMSTLGFIVIPWTLIGELLPISFRGIGGGVMISFAYLMMFVVVQSYPFAIKAIGPQNVFFFFSFVSLVGIVFVYLFLPETLGKSLKEIEKYFDKKEDSDENVRGQSLVALSTQ